MSSWLLNLRSKGQASIRGRLLSGVNLRLGPLYVPAEPSPPSSTTDSLHLGSKVATTLGKPSRFFVFHPCSPKDPTYSAGISEIEQRCSASSKCSQSKEQTAIVRALNDWRIVVVYGAKTGGELMNDSAPRRSCRSLAVTSNV